MTNYHFTGILYFYPRSPCGERHAIIHLSTPTSHFYPRSPCGERLSIERCSLEEFRISIHALLAESDPYFLLFKILVKSHFYPRSPCGERRLAHRENPLSRVFLSTLSLRRATGQPFTHYIANNISIHALLAESDSLR